MGQLQWSLLFLPVLGETMLCSLQAWNPEAGNQGVLCEVQRPHLRQTGETGHHDPPGFSSKHCPGQLSKVWQILHVFWAWKKPSGPWERMCNYHPCCPAVRHHFPCALCREELEFSPWFQWRYQVLWQLGRSFYRLWFQVKSSCQWASARAEVGMRGLFPVREVCL